ncbi:serine/threonine dehydratase [Microtetraspora sp. NBRC 13810]|uniref:threonine ammonia-lyase n=1 Tax=Microtetraspora sp. NBRC 13810 TaxID=3030990 RepID=UPI0024A160C6|nr:threonine/serine dehydratase [Microtetraspora sp. NBRC 13810]GLW10026.1 serine/threonine dehydratase [Microtetraspora sp. NBRC 13810]
MLPTIDDVRRAQAELRGRVVRTPVLASAALDELTGCPTLAKAECLQLTGSFKVRGALYRISTLPAEALAGGLVTVSAGNAALGAAHACRELGVELTVVMPEKAVPEKLAAVEALGATVVKDGVTSSAVAFERAEVLRAERGLTFVHPFDDPMVIAGAATATLELLEDHPRLERLLVPCSGGGLLAGAIMAARTAGSSVEIVGVQPSGADGIVRSLAAGRPVAPPAISTIADGLTAPKPGEVNLSVISDAGIRVLTVGEEAIHTALGQVVRALRVVVEPSAAVGLAALSVHAGLRDGARTGLLLSGSNVNWRLLAEGVIF